MKHFSSVRWEMVRPASKTSMATDGEYHMHVVHRLAVTQQCEVPFLGAGGGRLGDCLSGRRYLMPLGGLFG